MRASSLSYEKLGFLHGEGLFVLNPFGFSQPFEL